MGICISKCCFHPTDNDIGLPQPEEKKIISQHNHPTKPATSFSSSSASNSTSSFSVTSTGSSSCEKPILKLKPYTNEFLLSCAKENPHIVILDPHKHRTPVQKPRSNQPMKQSSIKLASKRERSSSPQRPVVRAKSLRRDRIMMTDDYKSERMSYFAGEMKHRRKIGAKGDGMIRSLSPCKSVCKRNVKDHSGDSVMEDIDNPLISMECFIFL